MASSPTRTCPRCRQSLPEGTNFSIPCGFYNETPALDRTAGIHLEMGKRKDRLAFWQRLANLLPIFRISR